MPTSVLKSGLKELSPASPKAFQEFGQALPRLLGLVDEKFDVESRFCCPAEIASQIPFLKDIHHHFGKTLLAVFQFHLAEQLADEFAWFVSTLSSRGLPHEYFQKYLDAWVSSLHGILPPQSAGELAAPLRFLLRHLEEFPVLPASADSPLGETPTALLDFLLQRKRRDAADYVLSIFLTGARIETLGCEFFAPVLGYVGHLWQTNKISAADEHAATEICRYIVFRLFDSLPRPGRLPHKAFVTCVPGEEHSLTAEMTAEYLEAKGWTVYYSGRSAPLEDIVRSAADFRPDAVFLSASLVAHLPQAVELAARLREKLSSARIIAGGRASFIARDVLKQWVDVFPGDVAEAYAKVALGVKAHA
jgi:methanogenic corrinoid protein MtbC1